MDRGDADWRTGARGERWLVSRLDNLRPQGIAVLHRRSVRDGDTTVDHVVVAPSGIWVIDATADRGDIEQRDAGGWYNRVRRLYVGGRDRSELIEAIQRKVDAVRALVADVADELSVRPALCFIAADFGLFGRPFELDDVLVTTPRRIVKTIQESEYLDAESVERIAAHLERAMRASSPRGELDPARSAAARMRPVQRVH